MNPPENNMLHPNFFYDHGRDPALKELVYLISANGSTTTGINRNQTMYYNTHAPRRFAKFKNMQEFFVNTCMANTIPRTMMVYTTISMASYIGWKSGRGFLPIGHYGVRNLRNLNAVKVYGLAGIVGPVAAMALSAYIWYRASVYTGSFIINNVLYGKRDYLHLYTTYNNEFGNYAFSDHTFMDKKTGKKFGSVVKEVEDVKNDMMEERKQEILDALEAMQANDDAE